MQTKYGVEIPCDSNGQPLRDAPGRYSQANAAMGGATEHQPTDFDRGRADRLAGLPCSSANGAYLDGWYSVQQKGSHS